LLFIITGNAFHEEDGGPHSFGPQKKLKIDRKANFRNNIICKKKYRRTRNKFMAGGSKRRSPACFRLRVGEVEETSRGKKYFSNCIQCPARCLISSSNKHFYYTALLLGSRNIRRKSIHVFAFISSQTHLNHRAMEYGKNKYLHTTQLHIHTLHVEYRGTDPAAICKKRSLLLNTTTAVPHSILFCAL
jgi:hypothetical protein